MFSRLGDAMKDVAETLRRVYQDPPAREVPLRLTAQPRRPFAGLEPLAKPGLAAFAPLIGGQRLQPETALKLAAVALEARLMGQEAWASWASGARVAVMMVFESQGTGRLEVPSLPRRPKVGAIAAQPFSSRSRLAFDRVATPPSRVQELGLGIPSVRKALELALGMPVAIAGEDLRTAPKPLQMRCSLQLVKATGENVRNLDLLGRYLIPRKGVKELRHDAASGRLMVLLGPEAAGSGQALLLIARRKDDRGLITCFAEES